MIGHRLGAADGRDADEVVSDLIAANAAMRRSSFWKLRERWVRIKQRLRLMGADPLAEENIVMTMRIGAMTAATYARWRENHDPRREDLERYRLLCGVLATRPRFSVVMPVCDPQAEHLRAALDSLRGQVYDDWELVIADDASRSPAVLALLATLRDDPRITLVTRERRGGISAATNDALARARGDFVAFLDHDDLYAPHALAEYALAIAADSSVDVLYSDEDKIDGTRRFDPYFKPDWSPETFLSKMYPAHLIAYRRQIVEEAGGLRSQFDGSQDYDLLLRVSERTQRIVHVPAILYHWRAHDASTAGGIGAKPYALDAGRRALEAALERRGDDGRVTTLPQFPGRYHVRYAVRGAPAVRVVVPTRDEPAMLARAVDSVFARSTYADVRVTVVDNGSTEPATAATLERFARQYGSRISVLRDDRPFNFSALNNAAVRATTEPIVVFLNNDTEVISPDWLEAMLSQAQREPIGAVGAMLLYADGRVQHAGVIVGINGVADHAHRYFPSDAAGYFLALQAVTNYSAVTAACMMIRRDVFEQAGGFDEDLPVAWNDVDLCMRVRAAGYRNVYVPDARLYHLESHTRGSGSRADALRNAAEVQRVRERWEIGFRSDPCYNRWLTLSRGDFGIGA